MSWTFDGKYLTITTETLISMENIEATLDQLGLDTPEGEQLNLLFGRIEKEVDLTLEDSEDADIEAAVLDWRDEDYVPPEPDEGSCGECGGQGYLRQYGDPPVMCVTCDGSGYVNKETDE